ncbi:MAG: DEAD/DEAH box helicase [Verrucomicrobia bacterium]|nr:DEAD/DEAH box helicase [Verrucomicrobiota bacterium]
MSVFDLHSSVLADYRDYVRSFFTVADGRAREFIDRVLVQEQALWPEPMVQVSPSYARAAAVDDLVEHGVILRETAEIFRTERGSPTEFLELNERVENAAPQGQPFNLYQHQVEALERARRAESYLVTTGTGSGKSLTYFLPIIDAFLRRPTAADRVAALVVYPMNALVNSQLEALKKLKRGYEQRTDRRLVGRLYGI